jgi:hypothetical protein
MSYSAGEAVSSQLKFELENVRSALAKQGARVLHRWPNQQLPKVGCRCIVYLLRLRLHAHVVDCLAVVACSDMARMKAAAEAEAARVRVFASLSHRLLLLCYYYLIYHLVYF